MPWNCIFTWNNSINADEWCNEKLEPWTFLKIWIWSGNEYVYVKTANLADDFDQNLSWFQIYFHTGTKLNGETWFRYDYTWTEDEKTWFARYLLITWVVDNGSVLPKDKILKVESHVLYQRWAITWEKVMETFIGNYEFKQ